MARHRALHKSSTPISTLTGSLSLVGSHLGSVRRSGVIIAMSSGLVASMALPAQAVNSAPIDAGGSPQTASVPAISAAESSTTFFAAPEGGLLALPPDLLVDDGPVTAPAAATVDFDHTAFVAVPAVQLSQRFVQQPTPDANGTQTRLKISQSGDDAAASTGRRVARAGSASGRSTSGQSAQPATSGSNSSGSTQAEPVSTSIKAASVSFAGSSAVAIASRYLGVAYRWGGTSPRGFDCSGLTQYVYGLIGKSLPRTVAQQRGAVRIVSRSQARPGDLVIFGTSHIGIYVGGNKMIDAPHSGARVTIREIYSASVVFGQV